jgi:hypothetical protein
MSATATPPGYVAWRLKLNENYQKEVKRHQTWIDRYSEKFPPADFDNKEDWSEDKISDFLHDLWYVKKGGKSSFDKASGMFNWALRHLYENVDPCASHVSKVLW